MKTMNVNVTMQQLGGYMFMAMTGSKAYSSSGWLKLQLRKNKSHANLLLITLEEDDTYTMRFMRQGSAKDLYQSVDVEVSEGIYCDMLQREFTRVTGLLTHL